MGGGERGTLIEEGANERRAGRERELDEACSYLAAVWEFDHTKEVLVWCNVRPDSLLIQAQERLEIHSMLQLRSEWDERKIIQKYCIPAVELISAFQHPHGRDGQAETIKIA